MSEHIIVEHRGSESRIELRSAEPGNALPLAAIRDLAEAIRVIGQRGETRVLRLRGRGEDFSVGRAPDKPGGDAPKTAHEVRTRLVNPILDVYAALRELPFPCIAEVRGRAVGFGCALVAACDLAVAGQGARFSLPEMAKELPPTLALSALARKVSAKTVATLVYGLGELDAGSALRAGLVGEVIADDRLEEHVDALCSQVAARNPLALMALRRYLQTLHDADAQAMAELAASTLSGAVASIRAGNTER